MGVANPPGAEAPAGQPVHGDEKSEPIGEPDGEPQQEPRQHVAAKDVDEQAEHAGAGLGIDR